jgi:transcriptional regulator with XRE-family HTH domain
MSDTAEREGRVVRRVPADTFAHRLLLARAEAGNLTIDDAAKRCTLGAQNWSNWEKGRIPRDKVEVAEAISEGLGIDRDWLLHGGPLTPAPSGRKVRHT